MPGDGRVGAAPCGHMEIVERFVTSDSGLVFCTRCQRGYEARAHPDMMDVDARHIRELLAYALL